LSTLRAITTPSIGAEMIVCSQVDARLLDVRGRLADRGLAALQSARQRRRSSPGALEVGLGQQLLRGQLFARSSFCRVSSTAAFVRSTLARAATRLACDCPSRAWNSDGSSRAMTWPFFTTELKSDVQILHGAGDLRAHQHVVTAWSVPVAPTTSTMSPRSTVTSGSAFRRCGRGAPR
jgi:hypothetical protein